MAHFSCANFKNTSYLRQRSLNAHSSYSRPVSQIVGLHFWCDSPCSLRSLQLYLHLLCLKSMEWMIATILGLRNMLVATSSRIPPDDASMSIEVRPVKTFVWMVSAQLFLSTVCNTQDSIMQHVVSGGFLGLSSSSYKSATHKPPMSLQGLLPTSWKMDSFVRDCSELLLMFFWFTTMVILVRLDVQDAQPMRIRLRFLEWERFMNIEELW